MKTETCFAHAEKNNRAGAHTGAYNIKKHIYLLFITILCLGLLIFSAGCDKVIGGDNTSSSPAYAEADGKILFFTLEFRFPGSSTEVSEGDSFAHSTLDGELISSWQIPMFGKTVYESVVKYFDGEDPDPAAEIKSDKPLKRSGEKFTFRLSGHRYYMFHDCVLQSGETYNLETVYVAADGKYADCANFQKLCGADGIFGTEDDLKVLTLVYKGWLY